ncbi:MAG: hypothetical protein WCJ35_03820 [Planctomycetota bacterium]
MVYFGHIGLTNRASRGRTWVSPRAPPAEKPADGAWALVQVYFLGAGGGGGAIGAIGAEAAAEGEVTAAPAAGAGKPAQPQAAGAQALQAFSALQQRRSRL